MTITQTIQRQWHAAPWQVIGWAALGLTLLIFISRLSFFFGSASAGTDLIEFLYVFAWLLVVTAFNRTVSLFTVVAFWFIGLYGAYVATLLVGQPIIRLTGNTTEFSAIVASISEETIKALPVALWLFFVARRNRWQTAASDGLLLGYAVGAGFAFHEDVIIRLTSGSGWGATSWSLFFPTLLYQFSRPTLGHDAWTALVGLGLGLGFLLRHWRGAWLLPLAALAIVILDHGTANWVGREARNLPAPVAALNALLLSGQLPIILLLGGIGTTLVFEQRILRWAAAREHWFPDIPLWALLAEASRPFNLASLLRLRDALTYRRYRRAAHYAAWRWRNASSPVEAGDELAGTLALLGAAAGVEAIEAESQAMAATRMG